jgi:hypothetical protein
VRDYELIQSWTGPGAIYEKILEWLQAGFTPQDFKLLQADIKQVMTTIFNTAIEKYRIPLKESLWAFVIPGKKTAYSLIDEADMYLCRSLRGFSPQSPFRVCRDRPARAPWTARDLL